MTAHAHHGGGAEHVHQGTDVSWSVALSATLHCLTGCAIGEVLGMIIGTALGWSNGAAVALSIALAFLFGYSLTSLPLLRPLVAWDKDEIIAEARRIGTAEISKLPDEDCCSLLSPPRVATRTTPTQLESVERRMDLDELVPKLLADVQVHVPRAE